MAIENELRKDLRSAAGGTVHLTSDSWTSNQTQSYLCVTAHWLSTQGFTMEQKHATLALIWFQKAHTAENIVSYLEVLKMKWLTPLQLEYGCISTDNGANFLKAVRDSRMEHIPCIAHCLNLVVRSALKESGPRIQKALEVARKVTTHFRQSCSAMEEIHKFQRKNSLPEHKFPLDVATRWNSTLHMLRRLCEQTKAVREYFMKRSVGFCVRSDQWLVLEDLVVVLGLFDDCTTVLSSNSANIGQVLPTLDCLQRHLEHCVQKMATKAGEAVGFAHILLHALENNKHIATICKDKKYMAASLLVPSYRNRFREGLKKRDIQGWRNLREYIVHHSMMVHKKKSEARQASSEVTVSTTGTHKNPTQDQQPAASTQMPAPPVISKVPSENRLFSWMYEVGYSLPDLVEPPSRNEDQLDEETSVRHVLYGYLREKFSAGAVHPLTDPTKYWEDRITVWPNLSTVALWHLSCPPSSVPSERLFSTAGNIVTKLRTRLTPLHICRMVFIRANMAWVPEELSEAPPSTSTEKNWPLNDEADTEQEILKAVEEEAVLEEDQGHFI